MGLSLFLILGFSFLVGTILGIWTTSILVTEEDVSYEVHLQMTKDWSRIEERSVKPGTFKEFLEKFEERKDEWCIDLNYPSNFFIYDDNEVEISQIHADMIVFDNVYMQFSRKDWKKVRKWLGANCKSKRTQPNSLEE